MRQIILFLLFFVLTHPTLMAQNNSCGTTVSRAAFEQEVTAQQTTTANRTGTTERLKKKVSILAYIINESTTEAVVNATIDTLNSLYSKIELSFGLCGLKKIYSPIYTVFEVDVDELVLVKTNYKPDFINLYFVDSLFIKPNYPVKGYTHMPNENASDVIIVSDPKEVSHQMGHFLGLYHTSETDFGEELVNGDNCATTGDLICDTEADPFYFDIPWNKCNILEDLKDANAEFYGPPTNNNMSLYDSCRCIFTTQQYSRMANEFLTKKNYLR